MSRTIFRFTFKKEHDIKEIEDTISLAVLAAGCLLGESAVRLDFGYTVGPSTATGLPTAVLGFYGQAGECVVRIFTGFASHEYGNDSFKTIRVETNEQQ